MQNIFRLITTQPQLLVNHAGAYSELIFEELIAVTKIYKRNAFFSAVALLLGAVGIGLVGVALLICAAIPASQIHSPWLLWLVPAAPLVGAFVSAMAAMVNADHQAFKGFRSQLNADLAILADVQGAA